MKNDEWQMERAAFRVLKENEERVYRGTLRAEARQTGAEVEMQERLL